MITSWGLKHLPIAPYFSVTISHLLYALIMHNLQVEGKLLIVKYMVPVVTNDCV